MRAFGGYGDPESLPGGENPAWRVGNVVLKRVDVPIAQLEWQASLFDSLQAQAAFRVPSAVRSDDGGLSVDGWYGTKFLRGRHEPARWIDIVNAGEAFHAAVSSVPRPAFLDDRNDPWAIGDRVAWGDLRLDDVPETKHLDRLLAHLVPVEGSPQLIHGDLTGNVLFDDQLPPVILDLSPYYRPPSFASAIVVADALVWEGAHASLLKHFMPSPDFPQYLLRALIYRAVTDRLFRLDHPLRRDEEDPYLEAVEVALEQSVNRRYSS